MAGYFLEKKGNLSEQEEDQSQSWSVCLWQVGVVVERSRAKGTTHLFAILSKAFRLGYEWTMSVLLSACSMFLHYIDRP